MSLSSIEILSKIFKNPEDDLALFKNLNVLEFYEDEKSRVYVKTLEYNGKDKDMLKNAHFQCTTG